MKPRILDLFCGAGGCSVGYHRAGFDVVGVDCQPMPRYPFEFHQGDALEFAKLHGHEFDAIHASPPCQGYSIAMRHLAVPAPRLIGEVRALLQSLGRPWVIENVPGAPLRNPLILCGTAFGLRVHRHRLFECDPHIFCLMPECAHDASILNPHRSESRERIYAEFGKQDPEKIWGKEMGVPWMNRHETRQAIPPAYTEFIGKQLLQAIAEQCR
jgi:DNA (cytosine-5)-methyltransferase 1